MRDIWTHSVGSEEEYDRGCVAVGNVDGGTIEEQSKLSALEIGRQNKVVTGSLDGMLRIFHPSRGPYEPSDLVLEQKLDGPILQLAIARFSSASATMELAVLHPRSLSVFRVVSETDQETGKTKQSRLEKKYTHQLGQEGLHFTACNMVHGTFGHENTRMHSICVQSMDCQLAFFSGEIPSFSRYLPTGLIPGPLCYVHESDIFVTCSPDMKIQAFKFQTIASAKKQQGGASESSIKCEWECNIGEYALQIISSRVRRGGVMSPHDVVVIGEHSLLFIDNQTGDLFMQRRLEYKSTAVCSYPSADNNCDNIIVASNTGHVMVYDNLKLIWASNVPANTTATVVFVQVTSFFEAKGLITIMDDEGQLAVACLGTRPSPAKLRDDDKPLDFDAMDEEHRKLLAIIRQAQATEVDEPIRGSGGGGGSGGGKVVLRAKCPPHLEEEDAMDEYDKRDFEFIRTTKGVKMLLKVRLYVLYKCNDASNAAPLKNVNVAIHLPSGLIARENSFCIDSLAGTSEANATVLPIFVYPSAQDLPAVLDMNIVAAYSMPNGEPRTSSYQLALPLGTVCKLMPAVKLNNFKFTLEVNKKNPPRLTKLYHDMVEDPQVSKKAREKILGQTSNVVSFCYMGTGLDCTILGSKSGGRFRIQSSCLNTMLLVTSDFISRLKIHFSQEGGEEFEASYVDPLPLADFLEAAENHFHYRKTLISAVADLDNRAHQFRSIQKRLLVRYKDRNSAPLDHLDTLLAGTFDKIHDASVHVDECRANLRNAAQNLSLITGLVVLLMRHRYSLDEENFNVIKCALSTHIDDSDTGDEGWEERTDAAVMHLLRTTLAKTTKESTMGSAELTPPKNLKKFRKHITILCDRLSKGALPAAPAESPDGK